MLGRVSSLEEAVQVQSAKIEEEWSKDSVHVLGESVMAEIRQEARNAIVPKGVLNIASKMLHVPSNSICFKQDPKLWVTTCGCNWVCGDGICKPIYDLDDVASDDMLRRCRKYFG